MKPIFPYFEQPVIEVAGLQIHGFALFGALGCALGSWYAIRRARRSGLDADLISLLLAWLIVGGIAGAHVFYGLFYAPDEFFAHPIRFLEFWNGLSSFGGIFVGLLGVIFLIWWHGYPILRYLDGLLFAVLIFFAFARFGCFLAHDHPGTVSNFWFAVPGICPGARGDVSLACHDLALYEVFFAAAAFLVVWLLARRPRPPGLLVLVVAPAYAALRFFLDGLRPEVTDRHYLGYAPGQYAALVLGVLCIFLLLALARSASKSKE